MKKTFYNIFRQKKTKEIKIPYRLNWCSAYMDCIEEKVVTSVIDKYMTFTYALNKTGKISVYSAEADYKYTISVNECAERMHNWCDYVNGCVAVLGQRGYNLKVGVNIYVDNDLPSGMGMASSACFLIGIVKILLEVNGFKYNSKNYYSYDDSELAASAYEVEHDFLRIPCGLMDFKAVLHTTGVWLIDTSVCWLEQDTLITDKKLDIILVSNESNHNHNHLNNINFKSNVAQLQSYMTYKNILENSRLKYLLPAIAYCETQRKLINNLVDLFQHRSKSQYSAQLCDVILNTSNKALNKFLGYARFLDAYGVQALGSGIGGYGFKVIDKNNAPLANKYHAIYCHTL